ncbi:helix-turn-helix domain-containing protein [Streptomyces sp. NPDC058308]|uniref:helix-turn-helix domain-containing protein n=1 Tax=Streptomyces sp. NPDC058308 TaxID=3346440 RepID=UPI0036EE96CA
MRARIILACADGASNASVAAHLGHATTTVRMWRSRFADQRIPGLVGRDGNLIRIEDGRAPRSALVLSDYERAVLGKWARAQSTSLALRAKIVLACAEIEPARWARSGHSVAQHLKVSSNTVSKWRARFVADRLDGLTDLPRGGRKRTVTDEQVAELVRLTLETKPANAARWSTRSMARRAGMSQSTVARVWRVTGLKPHHSE